MPWNREGQRTKQSAKETITNQARKVLLFHYLDQELVSYLVLWAQSTTKDYIRAEHKLYLKVSHFTSHFTTCHVFWAYLYSAGTQDGNLTPAGWPILFCGPTQEPVLAAANTWKNRKRCGKKCRWMDRKGKNKQGMAVRVACMARYWPTPGLKGRTFKLCVLTRWNFNFCVRSSPSHA